MVLYEWLRKGETEGSYTIYSPKSIKLSKDGAAYTGKAIKPKVIVTDYDEACAVARALGYDILQIHEDDNGRKWCYGILCHGADNKGTLEEDLAIVSTHFFSITGCITESDGINTKDGRIYNSCKQWWKLEYNNLGVTMINITNIPRHSRLGILFAIREQFFNACSIL